MPAWFKPVHGHKPFTDRTGREIAPDVLVTFLHDHLRYALRDLKRKRPPAIITGGDWI